MTEIFTGKSQFAFNTLLIESRQKLWKNGIIHEGGKFSQMATQIDIFPIEAEGDSKDTFPSNQIFPNMEVLPFVKWAGGKRSILLKISEHLPTDIAGYHEPFVGGGAVFFAFEYAIKTATLADLNKELIMAYNVVATDTDNLIEALQKHERNHIKKSDYYMQIRNKKPRKPIHIVSRFIYLNRTCYNGLYRVNKSGQFNVPEGKYTNPKICAPENLKNVAKALQKATIKLGQFDETLSPKQGDFVYCDPPYDGTFTGYQPDGFNDTDQIRLKETADLWGKQGASVMISNSDTPFIRDLYKEGYHIHTITAQRNISCNGNTRGKTAEVLIKNYE